MHGEIVLMSRSAPKIIVESKHILCQESMATDHFLCPGNYETNPALSAREKSEQPTCGKPFSSSEKKNCQLHIVLPDQPAKDCHCEQTEAIVLNVGAC